jgi:DNA polymerase-3 subunit gamma/tau
MRDSLSALDQVRAFAGDVIAVEDVVTVLGLVGRDLVLDMLDAVAAEDAPAAFALVERAMERGNDLRILCRELARATRDLLILSVDPARAGDAEVAAEGERERLKALAARSSREDLLRAFDLLTKAEQEIRISDQPRYNMEMTLLRLMYLRKLTPLSELLASGAPGAARPAPPSRPTAAASGGLLSRNQAPAAPGAPVHRTSGPGAPVHRTAPIAPSAPGAPVALKDHFLSTIKSSKVFFYNTVVAQAYRVDVTPSRITFTFLPNQRVPRQQCEEARLWLESMAEKVAGTKIPVSVETSEATPAQPSAAGPKAADPNAERQDALRKEAMADPSVQALLEIFPVENTKVEEM